MSVVQWATGAEADPDFARAWQERLSRTPHANFSLSLDYLRWRARHGEAARAVLLDEGGRRGAMVLREAGGEVVVGFPWRWQIVIEDADPAAPEGMTEADAAWFHDHAQRLAGGRRLRLYAPHRGARGQRGYLAGQTVLIDLAHATEAELFARMDASRRRLARRSEKQGFEVREDASPAVQKRFAELQNDTAVRRHGLRASPLAEAPEPGEAWREWELPWHWLLVAVKEGEVAAGLGLGRYPGGMVDGRAAASSERALAVGVNSLLWWESLRRARLAGHSWMNLGGATVYKREFGGAVVPVYCRLGGGVRWRVPNLVEKWARRGRLPAATMWRNLLRRLRRK